MGRDGWIIIYIGLYPIKYRLWALKNVVFAALRLMNLQFDMTVVIGPLGEHAKYARVLGIARI